MDRVKVLDKEFQLSIPEDKIQAAVLQIARKMNKELADKNPLLICILNGSFMFAADLMKHLNFPCQISFVKLASYEGTQSSGKITELIGLKEDLEGRTVVLLEDIIDTGVTMHQLIKQVNGYAPAILKIASLLFKPEACIKDLPIDYIGIEIANDFIVGYGLDYNGYGRNFKNIYSVVH